MKALIEKAQNLARRHWGWLLLLIVPLALFILLHAVFQALRPRVTAIDPVEKADQRAEVEQKVRQDAAEAVREDLEEKLGDLKANRESAALESFQEAEKAFNELRQDPDKLVEAMKRVGKGEKL